MGLENLPSIMPWLASEKPVRIAVIGDVILDEYIEGTVSRISPEAPIPVQHVQSVRQSAGGAAFVARNIKLVGGEVALFSVCGNDDTAQTLRTILETDGISCAGILTASDRPTVKKTRVSANRHQIVRLDWEKVLPIAQEMQDRLFEQISAIEVDAILISDYGKGCLPIRFLSNILELAAKKGIPSVVDPKGKDFGRYLHAKVITPNKAEACMALGLDPEDEWSGEELALRLQETFGLQNVLVTMGAHGMVMVPAAGQSGQTVRLAARTREVYDVSGAGDAVVAILTLSLASGLDFTQSMYLANLAAGRVVEKWGTQPITRADLEEAISQERRSLHSLRGVSEKILFLDEVKRVLARSKCRDKKIVFTNGCFDILHAGHVSYLEEAKRLGDILVVGVNSNESVRRIKGPERPIQDLEFRARVLAGLAAVDYVVPFDEDTPLGIVEGLLPDILVKGADWSVQDIAGSGLVQGNGGEVRTIRLTSGVSTTAIIQKIRQLSPSSAPLAASSGGGMAQQDGAGAQNSSLDNYS